MYEQCLWTLHVAMLMDGSTLRPNSKRSRRMRSWISVAHLSASNATARDSSDESHEVAKPHALAPDRTLQAVLHRIPSREPSREHRRTTNHLLISATTLR
ncbi:hypothetical protein F01_50167 [Burkholderia cenocepacia]|nr:hypothetical protein F01_50167 [Burkholderia cenocepacia]